MKHEKLGEFEQSPKAEVYRSPPTILHFLNGETRVVIVATMLMDRDEALRQPKFHLHRAQQTVKKYVDAHRRHVTFTLGDWPT